MLAIQTTKKDGSLVLYFFNDTVTYRDMLLNAICQSAAVAEELINNSDDADSIRQARDEQISSWATSLSKLSGNDERVGWAERTEIAEGIQGLVHSKKGTKYFQGKCIGSIVLQAGDNVKEKKATNHRNAKTAAKAHLRNKLTGSWRMVSINEDSVFLKGQAAQVAFNVTQVK